MNDEEEQYLGRSVPITISDKQFARLIQTMQKALIRDQNVASATPTIANQSQGIFAKYTSRFIAENDSDVNAFIDSIVTCKDCSNIIDDHALKGLPILFMGLAETWWQGVKSSVSTWDEALNFLRKT